MKTPSSEPSPSGRKSIDFAELTEPEIDLGQSDADIQRAALEDTRRATIAQLAHVLGHAPGASRPPVPLASVDRDQAQRCADILACGDPERDNPVLVRSVLTATFLRERMGHVAALRRLRDRRPTFVRSGSGEA